MLFCHRKNMDFLLTVFIGNEDQWENEDQPWHSWETCWMKNLMKQQGIDGRSNAGNQWIPPESGFDISSIWGCTHGDIYIYHQLNIVVGSEKGGYLSSWLWHVMNLWTFNRKQDDRNHPHIRWGLPGRISLVPATAWILESRGQDHGNQTRPVAFPDEITRL